MKQKLKTFLTVLMTTALFLGATSPVTAFAENEKGKLSVNGVGKLSVTPDIATVNIGVQTDGVDATSVQKENAETMESVLNALKESGVDDKDIKTSSYYISPKYEYIYNQEYNTNEAKEVGYTVSNYVIVTIRDISETGVILDRAAEAGSNASYGLAFNVSNPEKYYNQALTEAIANAHEKSQILAVALDVSIGKPSAVSEQGYSSVTPIYTEKAMYDGAARVGGLGSSTPIEYGQLEIMAYVNVVFEYPIA